MIIKVISEDSIGYWAKDNGVKEPNWEDLTEEQFSEINRKYDYGWKFNSLEEFVNAFNNDDSSCPISCYHFIRIYEDKN